MTKAELIASVQKLILKQGVTQDSLKSVHPKVVEGEIGKAYNTVMKTYYANDNVLMNAELDFYAKKYTEKIKKDADGFFYIDLPARTVELKENLGIRSVVPKGGVYQFVRMRQNTLARVRHLPAYCCLKDAYFYIDGNRIVFDFPIAEHALIEEVYVKLLPLFEEFEDTDNIEFPGGDMAAMQLIMQMMGFRLTDAVNDDIK
jgi:hypothetical protein